MGLRRPALPDPALPAQRSARLSSHLEPPARVMRAGSLPRDGAPRKESVMEPSTTPEPTPAAPESPAPKVEATPDPQAQPDEGKGGKEAILADLAKERDKRQGLESKLTELESKSTAQLDAIAKALGLKDDAPDASAIAKQLEESQRQAADNAAALTRFQVAVEKAVPSHLVEFITGSTREEVEASVEKVLHAFGTSTPTPTGPKPDPSQGQQGTPTTLEAQIAAAEQAGNTREVIRLKARKGLTS